MPTPIEKMIDASAKCAKCGAPMGKCSCWITLRCPKCKRARTVEREDYDPKNCAVIECSCDRCNHFDSSTVDYFDAEGRQINLDGELITTAS